MSWISETPITFFQRFCMNVLKCGPIPRHIAFIMDGNRRFASKIHVQTAEGHNKGFEKLAETLQWCLELGIIEVTVYAFSIENFKRSEAEVETLMKLATEKFVKLLEEKERIMKEGVCIRVIGNLTLLSPELRKLVAEAVLLTKDNTRAYLNVAFAYTSRDEITNSINTIVDAVDRRLIEPDDISEELISECLYTSQSPDPDILVRTSGEVRFSDFLLHQTGGSAVCFAEVLWPEFSIWHLMGCVFQYQRNYNSLKIYRDWKAAEVTIGNDRVGRFVEQIRERRLEQLRSYLVH